MQIVKPSHEFLFMPEPETILTIIELAGRTCYKSNHKITADSAEKFVQGINNSGHLSVIEHMNITIRFVCDRGVSHEIVRHRLASYSQESSRYCNYSKSKFDKEITVIQPFFFPTGCEDYQDWKKAMEMAEKIYMKLLANGATPEEARSVLPNSLKTEIVMTCNIREWIHVLTLRCSPKAHPQIRELMSPLLVDLAFKLPVLFGKTLYRYANSSFVKTYLVDKYLSDETGVWCKEDDDYSKYIERKFGSYVK